MSPDTPAAAASADAAPDATSRHATGRRTAAPLRWLVALLKPGLRAMQRLRMTTKLTLQAACVGVPMVALLAVGLQGLLAERDQARIERQGATVIDHLTPLLLQTQKHRGLTHRLLSGDPGAQAERDDARAALKSAIVAMDGLLATRMDYSLDDLWKPLRGTLAALAEGRHASAAPAAFAEHVEAVNALLRMGQLNAERSGLVLDPEPRSYHLMNLVTEGVMPLGETAARARGLGAGMLVRGQGTAIERATLHGYGGALQQGLDRLADKLASLERAGGELPGSWLQARERLRQLIQAVTDDFDHELSPAAASGYFEMAGLAIGQLAALQQDATVRLQAELRQREEVLARQAAVRTGLFVLGMLAMTYLLACMSLAFNLSLRALRRGTEAIAQGDLAHRVQVNGSDELAEIGRIVDAMSDRLSALVSEIRNSASMVNLTGQQVSDGSSRLANRTDEQASSLRSSVSAIGELSGAVARNAEAARQLDGLTERLARQAAEGNAAMQDTVQAMTQMQQASQRVAEVVGVIDDVAFQTGMLSLNAAIEAARAGEAGKGFAVVASEVRQLAQRCAESADEIRNLIGDAGAQVQVSAEKLGNVSAALGVIVDGVNEVSQQLRSISASSTEQSAGLNDVTQTVGNLDEITRENAALVEESSTASHALVERAAKLREAVATMRLRQGSADEAMAMVAKALAHLQQVGRQQAMLDFHQADGGFIDRDLYIFSMDRNGIYSAFGVKPEMIGQSYTVVPGLTEDFLDKLWTVADAGGGWVQYEVVNPLSLEIMAKESFVQVAPDGTLLGCGIYRNDVSAGTRKAKPRASAWARTGENVLQATVS